MIEQDLLGDCLVQNKILQEKGNIGHKAIKLLQKRAHILTTTAKVGLSRLHDERTELERQLQGELASCQCQVHAICNYLQPNSLTTLHRS